MILAIAAEGQGILIEIVLLLAACLVGGVIASKLRQSPIIGYIAAGMLMGGPGSLGVITSRNDIEAIAEIGVVLLLFSLGLEFSWARLVRFGRRTLFAGGMQVVLTLAAVTAVALAVGLDWRTSFALGAMICLSSTAIVLRLLQERAEIDSPHGRQSVAILLSQDIALVPLALALALLAQGGDMQTFISSSARMAIIFLVFVAVLALAALQGIRRMLPRITSLKNREFITLLTVVSCIASAWIANRVGLSGALGAFLCGMFLGSTPYAWQIRADISSMRVVLLTLFFGAVGMVADPQWIFENAALVLGVTTVVLLLKVGVVFGVLSLTGWPRGMSLATGLCVAQVGEFAFVLGRIARDGALIDHDTYMLVVSVCLVSWVLTPWMMSWIPGLVGRFKGEFTSHAAHVPEVVIVGFGPAGKTVGATLSRLGRRTTVIDLNARSEASAREMGFEFVVGDASSRDILEHVHIEAAQVVVLAIPDIHMTLVTLDHVRDLAPQSTVIVRCRYLSDVETVRRAGADAVVDDEEQVARALVARLEDYLVMDAVPEEK